MNTTIRLADELKERIARIAEPVANEERHQAFQDEVEQRHARILASGQTFP